MSQYRTCPSCGAHLDPGEHCECYKHVWWVEFVYPDGRPAGIKLRGAEELIRRICALHGAEIISMKRIDPAEEEGAKAL